MKILMIAPTPFFADRGCHTRIYGEIAGLQELGHEALLCTYGLGRDVQGVKTKRTINFPWYKKLTAGPSITKILLIPCLAVTSLLQIHRYRPDVVHAFLHEGALIAKFCRLLYRKPLYIFDLQGSLSGEVVQHGFIKKKGILHRFFLSLEKRINRWFPIVTQSELLVNHLLDMGIPKHRIVNAMDSVDVTLFQPKPPNRALAKKYGIDANRPSVLYMGLLEKYQGCDLLFEAFAKVNKEKPDTQFIVIGFPNIERYKKICREKGLDKNAFFLGKVRFEQVPDYLSLSKIAVAPKISRHEGDGKLYNYMAMGMATVTFNRSVSREILGMDQAKPSGLFAEFANPDDLADKILTLLNQRERVNEIGKNARERAVAKLSHINSAKKIESFYLSCFNKNRDEHE